MKLYMLTQPRTHTFPSDRQEHRFPPWTLQSSRVGRKEHTGTARIVSFPSRTLVPSADHLQYPHFTSLCRCYKCSVLGKRGVACETTAKSTAES